jgi:hypothetical protein
MYKHHSIGMIWAAFNLWIIKNQQLKEWVKSGGNYEMT